MMVMIFEKIRIYNGKKSGVFLTFSTDVLWEGEEWENTRKIDIEIYILTLKQ